MPSPVGHALAGAAAGLLVAEARPLASGRSLWLHAALFAALGIAPDLDLIVPFAGVHRGPSHSLAAALLAGAIGLTITRCIRFALAVTVAYATHTLLDWLGTDTSAPVGLMALWPLTRDYYQSDAQLFEAISRRYWTAGFVAHNVRAIAWELLILLPPAAATWFLRTRTRRRSSP